jgi:hypothetical protein
LQSIGRLPWLCDAAALQTLLLLLLLLCGGWHTCLRVWQLQAAELQAVALLKASCKAADATTRKE